MLWGKIMEKGNIIEICSINKSYGQVKAVDNLSFKVKEGELFAFLGVNGAGKSTTISMMCNTLAKDSGEIFVGGVNIDDAPDLVRKQFGVVFQNSVLDKTLTVRENLEHRASLYDITGEEFEDRLNKLKTLLEFGEFINRPIAKLSGGQKRKIDIARALIHNPKILILDEPTTGLDPQTRKVMWSVVEKLRKERNMTVLLTKHYMEEAADADYVVIIDGGKIVAEGTPIQLKNTYTGDFLTIYGVDEQEIKELDIDYKRIGEGYRLTLENTAMATQLILKNPKLFVDYEITKGKMDDVFLSVTGKKLVGEEVK